MGEKWDKYWGEIFYPDYWQRIHVNRMLKILPQIMDFKQSDKILDIGCADGRIAAGLAKTFHPQNVCAVDISENLINASKKNFADIQNLEFKQLPPDDYLDFKRLGNDGFTKVICISVIQYYQSPDDLIRMLRNLKMICAPNCQIILADLLVDYSLIKDIIQLILGGMKRGYAISALKFLAQMALSNECGKRKKNHLLSFSTAQFTDILKSSSCAYKEIDKRFTLNPHRRNYLVQL